MSRSALLTVMVGAARKAARGLTRDFGEVENLQVSLKGPGDFVSAADIKAETILREELQRVRPTFGLLMEESGETQGSDPNHRWIVDPLDGTLNFLHGIPQFAISLALERQGQIVAGVVYNPVTDELFTAEKGSGAFLNDRRLRVSARREIAEALIGTGIPALGGKNHPRYIERLAKVMASAAGVRRFGSAALDLCWLAAGRMDGFFEFDLAPWDIAAGVLMVREAGGFVSDSEGRDRFLTSGAIVAGNEPIHKKLLELVCTP